MSLAIWSMLLATRLTRGEEDSGRADFFAVSSSTRQTLLLGTIGAIATGIVVFFLICTAITAIVGTSATVNISLGAASYFALSLSLSAALFGSLGLVAAQLVAPRRRASQWVAAVLGLSYVLRMIGDASTGTAWVTWMSPLGWLEALDPLVATKPFPLVPIVIGIGVSLASALLLSSHRDLGAGVVGHELPRHHDRVPQSLFGLQWKLEGASTLIWIGSIVGTGLLFGFVAKGAGEVVANSSMADVFRRLGINAAGTKTYLSLAFLLVAVLFSLYATFTLSSFSEEELSGRFDLLAVTPLSRARLLLERSAFVGVSIVAGALLVGVATELGMVTGGGALAFGTVEAAALATVAPALCMVGLTTFFCGVTPRWARTLAPAVIVWSFVVEVAAGISTSEQSLVRLSLFHWMSALPAGEFQVGGTLGLLAVGLLGSLVGVVEFGRRDLRTA